MEDVAPAPHSLPSGEDFTLDPALIKVLASDSRRDIIRHLGKRRMTLTELASVLDLKKATVLEHLKRLTDAGLIRRLEDERLWVYYELTRPGARLVTPGRTRFYFIMATTAAACLILGGAVVAAAFLAHEPIASRDATSGAPSAPIPTAAQMTQTASDAWKVGDQHDGRSAVAPIAWRGFDGAIALSAPNASGEGAFLLASTASLRSTTVPAIDGRASLEPAELDLLTASTYTVQYAAANTTGWASLGDLDVRDPVVVLSTLRLVEDQPATVRVELPALAPTPPVALDGATLAAARTDAALDVSLPALAPGVANLSVGRLFIAALDVVPNATLDVGAWDGSAWSMHLARRGVAAEGARVAFAGGSDQVTDANGTFRLAATGDSPRPLRVTFADGATFERAVMVDPGGVTASEPRFEVRDFTVSAALGRTDARISVLNTLPVNASVALTLYVDDAPVDARVVHLGSTRSVPSEVYEVHLSSPLDAHAHAARLLADVGPLVPVRGSSFIFASGAPAPTAATPMGDTSGSTQGHVLASRALVLAETSFAAFAPTTTTPTTSLASPLVGTPAAKVPMPGVTLGVAVVVIAALARRRSGRS